jgi:nucleotide-binding universal stress UspA family protein
VAVFERVVCGVDPSEESLEAVRQAGRLASPDGRVVLVAVAEVEVAVQAGWAAATVAGQLRAEAEQALESARGELEHERLAEVRLLEGPVTTALLGEARAQHAALLCVGTHGHRRASGILLGGTVTTIVHDAACSVLVARRPSDSSSFPSAIVVGLDGSPEGESAADVAAVLAACSGASLRRVVASHGKAVDVAAISKAHSDVESVEAKPIDALVSASETSDLVVLGSRGLHGMRALGSVSERVAHKARSSVLVVRLPATTTART